MYTFILVYYNWCIWYKTDAGWNCRNDGLEAIEHRTWGQRRHNVQRKSICEYLLNLTSLVAGLLARSPSAW